MLEDVKKVLGIKNSVDFDGIIQTYINAGLSDLKSVGLIPSLVVTTDPLIYSAVMSYVLSLLDTENAELYANAYSLQKDTLRHLGQYIE